MIFEQIAPEVESMGGMETAERTRWAEWGWWDGWNKDCSLLFNKRLNQSHRILNFSSDMRYNHPLW